MSTMSPSTTATADDGLRLIARCIADCGYEQRVADLAGRYCPYCAQDVDYAVDECRRAGLA